MSVVVQYVVVRDGAEKMTFTSKAEADAYDKMLDMADALVPLLAAGGVMDDEDKLNDLALHLAKEREALLIALGAKKAKKAKPKAAATESATATPAESKSASSEAA